MTCKGHSRVGDSKSLFAPATIIVCELCPTLPATFVQGSGDCQSALVPPPWCVREDRVAFSKATASDEGDLPLTSDDRQSVHVKFPSWSVRLGAHSVFVTAALRLILHPRETKFVLEIHLPSRCVTCSKYGSYFCEIGRAHV